MCVCPCAWACPQSFLSCASLSWAHFYWSTHNVSVEWGIIFNMFSVFLLFHLAEQWLVLILGLCVPTSSFHCSWNQSWGNFSYFQMRRKSSHSVKCSYWSGSNQRNPFEMKFQWSSKTYCFSKFTVQNLLDNAIKCYVSHGTDLRVPFKWISVSSLQKLQCQVRCKLISKIQVWCKVILVTGFQQSL